MRKISLGALLILLITGILVSHAWAENEEICFSFPDLNGDQETQVVMDLTVTHADSILAVDAVVTYPSDRVTAISVNKTDFSNNMFLIPNLNTPGRILIGMAGAMPIFADGVLFQITFELTGSPGEPAAIELTTIKINDVAHTDCIRNGSITINCILLPPKAATGAATSVSSATATLRGTVNPNGADTTVIFDWGTDETYGNEATATQSPLTGCTAQIVSAEIDGLILETTYHYRVRGINSAGTGYGMDFTFRTSGPVPIMYVNKDDGTCGGNDPCRQSITQAIEDADAEVLIKVTAGNYHEDLALTAPKVITLQGGYDSPYESQTGTTTANSMAINVGQITLSNFILGPVNEGSGSNEQGH